MKRTSYLLTCNSVAKSKDCFYAVIVLELFYTEYCIIKSFADSDYSLVLFKIVQENVKEIKINFDLVNFTGIGDSFFSFINFF